MYKETLILLSIVWASNFTSADWSSDLFRPGNETRFPRHSRPERDFQTFEHHPFQQHRFALRTRKDEWRQKDDTPSMGFSRKFRSKESMIVDDGYKKNSLSKLQEDSPKDNKDKVEKAKEMAEKSFGESKIFIDKDEPMPSKISKKSKKVSHEVEPHNSMSSVTISIGKHPKIKTHTNKPVTFQFAKGTSTGIKATASKTKQGDLKATRSPSVFIDNIPTDQPNTWTSLKLGVDADGHLRISVGPNELRNEDPKDVLSGMRTGAPQPTANPAPSTAEAEVNPASGLFATGGRESKKVPVPMKNRIAVTMSRRHFPHPHGPMRRRHHHWHHSFRPHPRHHRPHHPHPHPYAPPHRPRRRHHHPHPHAPPPPHRLHPHPFERPPMKQQPPPTDHPTAHATDNSSHKGSNDHGHQEANLSKDATSNKKSVKASSSDNHKSTSTHEHEKSDKHDEHKPVRSHHDAPHPHNEKPKLPPLHAKSDHAPSHPKDIPMSVHEITPMKIHATAKKQDQTPSKLSIKKTKIKSTSFHHVQPAPAQTTTTTSTTTSTTTTSTTTTTTAKPEKFSIDSSDSGCKKHDCDAKGVFCPHKLFKLSLANGCPTCECCHSITCYNKCPKGFKSDNEGCPSCVCR